MYQGYITTTLHYRTIIVCDVTTSNKITVLVLSSTF